MKVGSNILVQEVRYSKRDAKISGKLFNLLKLFEVINKAFVALRSHKCL